MLYFLSRGWKKIVGLGNGMCSRSIPEFSADIESNCDVLKKLFGIEHRKGCSRFFAAAARLFQMKESDVF